MRYPFLLTTAFLLLCFSSTGNAEITVLEKLSECKGIPDDQSRLTCFDKLADAMLPDSEKVAESLASNETPSPSAESGLAVAAPNAFASVPDKSNVTRKPHASEHADTATPSNESESNLASVSEAASLPEIEQNDKNDEFGAETMRGRDNSGEPQSLNAVVTKVKKNAFKKLRITLDNGQEWKQHDSKRFSLAKGDKVTIEKGVLTSYFLTKEGSDLRMKVKRTK